MLLLLLFLADLNVFLLYLCFCVWMCGLLFLSLCVCFFLPQDFCEVCRSTTDAKNMLLCDSCDSGYHTYCLKPPLPSIPPGDWFCPTCRKQKVKSIKAHKEEVSVTEVNFCCLFVFIFCFFDGKNVK